MSRNRLTRRDWLKGAAAGGTGMLILGDSRSARGYQANEKLNLAIIGAGGRGSANLGDVASENIVALCDVNQQKAAASFAKHPQAKQYRDYRKLWDDLENRIDAAVVSTTNHSHAPATMMALRRGKHVYCEKPGAHSVFEARTVARVAAEQRVATQLGTQMHATDNYRRIVELIRGGAIGEVRECHIWLRSGRGDLGDRPTETPPVPEWLDWDLWLGPAPHRPYHPSMPTAIRGGTSAAASWATWAATTSTCPTGRWNWALRPRSKPKAAAAPGERAIAVACALPVSGTRRSCEEIAPVTLTWTHGSQPSPIFAEHEFPAWAWSVFVGSRGMLLASYDRRMLWPEKDFADYQTARAQYPVVDRASCGMAGRVQDRQCDQLPLRPLRPHHRSDAAGQRRLPQRCQTRVERGRDESHQRPRRQRPAAPRLPGRLDVVVRRRKGGTAEK
jgi:hypothetical protein